MKKINFAHDLPQPVAAGKQVVQIPVQKGLDAPLSPADVHLLKKLLQPRLGRFILRDGWMRQM